MKTTKWEQVIPQGLKMQGEAVEMEVGLENLLDL